MKTLFVTAVALTALSTTAFANAGHAHKAMNAVARTATFSCPVSGDKIASAKAAYNHETYKGKTYYFCCPQCKPRFDKNRDQVIKHAARGKFEKM